MNSKVFFWTVIALAVIMVPESCKQFIDRQFDQIEQDLSFQPDSAYAKLLGISAEELRPESRRARYALLMSLAMDKSYIDVADDSLIQVAVNYYQRRGSAHEKMLALYSLGRVQRNAGNNTGAIISFLQAKELAEDLSDYHYIGLSARNMAELYGECYDEDSELDYYKESYAAFVSNGEEYYASYSKLGEARVLIAKGLTESADSLLRVLEDNARKGDPYLLGLVLMDRALNLMRVDETYSEEVISIYNQADSIIALRKTTADYGTIAFAYEILNKPDSVASYLVKASEAAKTSLDTTHLYNSLFKIFKRRKDFESANELLMKGLSTHNRLIYKRENQQIANAISAYNKQEAYRQYYVARYRLVLFILSLTGIVALLCVLVLVLVNRRYQIQEKTRIIQEKEQKIEEDLATIQDVSDQLQMVRDNQSEMAKAINDLIRERITIVKQCADAYEAVKNGPKENPRDPYRYLDEDPIKKKTDEMRLFLKALDDFRRDDSLFLLLEESVNKWRGNIMVMLRHECAKEILQRPRFSEGDFRILMLVYAGIPDRAIAFLMDMTCSAVRTRKTRYKDRFAQKDIPHGPFFAQEMVNNPPI